MFRIKNLTVKNFMSVGNSTQAVDFDRSDLTLVLGKNIDLGSNGNKNGTGKTSIVNALSYALYGQALTNIKRDNLINKTNSKGMLVTIEFEHNNTMYRIERGRKPTVMRFYVEGAEQEVTDDAQGDSRETQGDITKMIGMSHDMFKHIVALNTYTEPFLSLRTNDQKTIIEQLLGITVLSEKADALKILLKDTKDAIKEEEYRIKAETDANATLQEQVASMQRRQTMWLSKHTGDITDINVAIKELGSIDINTELTGHKKLAEFTKLASDISTVNTELTREQGDLKKATKICANLTSEVAALVKNTCYACDQELHNDKHEGILAAKETQLSESELHISQLTQSVLDLTEAIASMGYLGDKPTTFYSTEAMAYEHKSSITALELQLESKEYELDPYAEQILEMQQVTQKEISYDALNDLVKVRDHQDFLWKLLTNKDSFVRKRIIAQNLSYLNSRLSYYLDDIGLPHTVTFLSDLTVEIQELGRDLDFDNLSRGERTRLVLSLSWAFRDVYESLFETINLMFIDEVIDLGLDTSGVENTLGILKKMSRESNRSIWLVSHKDELVTRIDQVLTVTKEGGFTTYANDVDV